jgi:hypothetical protein
VRGDETVAVLGENALAELRLALTRRAWLPVARRDEVAASP